MTLKRTTLWVDSEDWEKFQSYAETVGESASHLLREAMSLYLKVLEHELLDRIFEDQRPEDEDTCV